jgi:hypothetical protein
MGFTRNFAVAALVLMLGGCGGAAAAEEIDTGGALTSSNEWLALIDAGRYGAAYEEAAESFRKGIEKVKWEVAAQNARAASGPLVNRRMRTATFTRTLPGAPDGEYVIVQFDSRFDRQPLVTEMVTSEREKDGRWRVAGYWIR